MLVGPLLANLGTAPSLSIPIVVELLPFHHPLLYLLLSLLPLLFPFLPRLLPILPHPLPFSGPQMLLLLHVHILQDAVHTTERILRSPERLVGAEDERIVGMHHDIEGGDERFI